MSAMIKAKIDVTDASSILGLAQKAVYGARRDTYGTPQENHQVTADLLNAYFGGKTGPFSNKDICIINILQKIARMRHGVITKDTCVDIAGYAENLALCEGFEWPSIEGFEEPSIEGFEEPSIEGFEEPSIEGQRPYGKEYAGPELGKDGDALNEPAKLKLLSNGFATIKIHEPNTQKARYDHLNRIRMSAKPIFLEGYPGSFVITDFEVSGGWEDSDLDLIYTLVQLKGI